MEISSTKCREVEVFDTLHPPLITRWPAAYSWLATESVWLYNLLFRLTDSHFVSSMMAKGVYDLSKRKIRKFLQDTEPDIIVATAPFVSEVATRARKALGANFRIVNVVADLVTPHASWSCYDADVTVVCTPSAKNRLQKAGTRSETIVESHFPVKKAFYEVAGNRDGYRYELDLDPKKFTILLSGGSLGSGPILSCTQRLSEEFPEDQLLVVAGRNEHLYNLIRSRFRSCNVSVYGFTDRMPTLLGASDVVISKGGPSSMMEAYVAGRPLIVIAEIGIQEKGNGALAQHLGIGHAVDNLDHMAEIVRSLKCGPNEIDVTERRPDPAGRREVAQLILSMCPQQKFH